MNQRGPATSEQLKESIEASAILLVRCKKTLITAVRHAIQAGLICLSPQRGRRNDLPKLGQALARGRWSSKESSVTLQYPLKRLQPLIIHRDSWVRKQLTFGGVQD